MSLSVTSSKMICGFDDRFAVDIGYRNYRIGFKTHPWGCRLMLLWWHICWHRKIKERVPYSKQHAKVCNSADGTATVYETLVEINF